MNRPAPDTRKGLVLALLEQREWVTAADINTAAVGGSSGDRRLRELRADGWPIERETVPGSSMHRYRLVPELGQLELFTTGGG